MSAMAMNLFISWIYLYYWCDIWGFKKIYFEY